MVQKRPFIDEELIEITSKQPRQLEPNSPLVSALEFPNGHVASQARTSGELEAGSLLSNHVDYQNPSSPDVDVLQTKSENEIEAKVVCSVSDITKDIGNTNEEFVRLEVPPHVFLTPECDKFDHLIRTVAYRREIYSSLLEHPPQKLVPIGTEFQAEIPDLKAHSGEKTSRSGDSCAHVSESDPVEDDESKFAGTCIITMPDLERSANDMVVGGGRTECFCVDMGSERCVRQHIAEARERLQKTIGQEAFVRLGFLEMGETVAEKWCEEDERLFFEVVCCNPASRGKNFWDHLAMEFPLRSKKELVSYYFNVLVLRRRAEQNRVDPLNIDSDNDEWEIIDDYTDDDNGHDHHEDGPEESLECYTHVEFDGEQNIFESCPDKLPDHSCPDPTVPENSLLNEVRDCDIQVDSCKSYEGRVAPPACRGDNDNNNYQSSNFEWVNGGNGLQFVIEPCNSKDEFGF